MLNEGDIVIRKNGKEEKVIRILKSHAATMDLETGTVQIMDIRPGYAESYRIKERVGKDTFLNVNENVVKLLLENIIVRNQETNCDEKWIDINRDSIYPDTQFHDLNYYFYTETVFKKSWITVKFDKGNIETEGEPNTTGRHRSFVFILGDNIIIVNQRYKKKFLVIDLDGTLIHTITGKTFPKGIWDMRLDINVLESIKNLNPEYILIATNQGGIEKGFVNRYNFEAKLEYIRRSVAEYAECENVRADYTEFNDEDNYYRKPNPGMFDEMFEVLQESGVTKEDCLMVGDASGNPGDFSDSDKKFAENCGIEYMDVRHFVDLYKKHRNK